MSQAKQRIVRSVMLFTNLKTVGRAVCFVLLTATVLTVSCLPSSAAVINWIGAGANDLWATTENWAPTGSLPAANDLVFDNVDSGFCRGCD